MKKTIRLLTEEDFPLYEKMDTGLEDDYMVQSFTRLTKKNHHLYGLFMDNRLAVVGGFSVYAETYAMLGRLRSDIRYRGKGLATELVQYVLDEALKLGSVSWAGAITEEKNKPAQRVLHRLGLDYYSTLYAATAEGLEGMGGDAHIWNPINSLNQKKRWLEKTYLKSGEVFSYECYYPFPASPSLFTDDKLAEWDFYENTDKSRFMIAKHDVKGEHFCQIIYPWSDFSIQEGFWETARHAHQKLSESIDENITVWMDLTKEEAEMLPSSHPFDLPSPWMVFGTKKDEASN